MTRAELDLSNAQNILATGKVTKERHSTHNGNIADYVDSQVFGPTYGGYFEASGDGEITQFTIFHDVEGIYAVSVTPLTLDSAMPHFVLSATSLQTVIEFVTPPPVGINNISFTYIIKKIIN